MLKVYIDNKRALSYFRRIIREYPKAEETSNKNIAKDVLRGARRRLQERRHKSPELYARKNWLLRSLGIRKKRKGMYECWQNPAIAPYGWAIEEGIRGRHFKPGQGRGVYGEGILAPGGQFPKRGPYHFMRDAGIASDARSAKITRKEIKKLIGEGK